jgi:acyl-CoA synthetase (NDP forming)
MVEENSQTLSKQHFLDSILNPKSICFFGANNNLMKTMGSFQLRNIITEGFQGNIYPIHPREEQVLGIKAYKSVLDLPETPDLAMMVIPTKYIPQVMEQCGQKGIKRLIITSGGFQEIGSEGKRYSQKIDEIAKKYEMRFIGPNCLGIYNGWYIPENKKIRFNTFWIYKLPETGIISIASQSGTVASHLFWYAEDIGTKIGKSLSIGNSNNIDIVDCLEYFKNDPQTKVIGLYIEEIRRGKEFINIAKEITPKKPIVAIYAGGSKAASRSISSHTGSIAGNDEIYEAVFKETGILSATSATEFFHYLRVLSHGIFPRGKRIGIITDSGGAGAMMAKANEKIGLEVPEFSEKLQSEISKYISDISYPNNPVDLTFTLNQYNLYVKLPKLLMKSGEVDGIMIYGAFGVEEFLEVMKKSGFETKDLLDLGTSMSGVYLKPIQKLSRKYSIPIFYVGPQGYSDPWIKEFISLDMAIFDLWDLPVKCMEILCQYSKVRKKFS